MATNPANWFEIPVEDLERAVEFYRRVFGFELPISELGNLRLAWFPMEMNKPGAGGTLVQGEAYVPSSNGILIYFSVEDIEAVLSKAEIHGGKTILPKKSIGEYGFVGQLEDSEGNRIGLHAMR